MPRKAKPIAKKRSPRASSQPLVGAKRFTSPKFLPLILFVALVAGLGIYVLEYSHADSTTYPFDTSGALLSAPTQGAGAQPADATPGVVYSSNGAGYKASATVDKARATFTIPKVTCQSGTQAMLLWTGLGSSTTLQQDGVAIRCNQGSPTYESFYEMYPSALQYASRLTIRPGDSVTATATYNSGSFTFDVTDDTTGASAASPPKKCPSGSSCGRSYDEWILERPPGAQLPGGWKTVTFSGATADRQGYPISRFTRTRYDICLSAKCAATTAITSFLTSSGKGFTVTND